jgi:hypothetical protein
MSGWIKSPLIEVRDVDLGFGMTPELKEVFDRVNLEGARAMNAFLHGQHHPWLEPVQVESMSGWIKVSEAEPLHDLFIIVWMPVGSGAVECGWFSVRGGRKELCLDDELGTTYSWDLVTHWMHWPDPPEDGE